MTSQVTRPQFAERLFPSIPFFVALLLLVPAVIILVAPFNTPMGVLWGVIVFLLASSFFLLSSRKLQVVDGVLIAGRASIPVDYLANPVALDAIELRLAIGRNLDARAHLFVSGWVHKGVRFEITDSNDPAPYWVITTRKPHELIAAVESAQASAAV